MGITKKPLLAKLFFACTYNDEFDIREFYEYVEKEFDSISIYSPIMDFSAFTKYYNKEMGSELKKQLIAISGTVNIEQLHKIKLKTNEIEDRYSTNNNRIINIDPGYLTEAKVVLFSTKNHIHRIYIADGIFAEITLSFRKDSYDANPKTYVDYRQKEFVDFFHKLRSDLRNDADYLSSKKP